MQTFKQLVAFALVAIVAACGEEGAAISNTDAGTPTPKATIVSFEAPSTSWNIDSVDLILVAEISDKEIPQVWTQMQVGVFNEEVFISPGQPWIRHPAGLKPDHSYTATVKVWAKRPIEGSPGYGYEMNNPDDMAYVTFRTAPKPKEDPQPIQFKIEQLSVSAFGSAQALAKFKANKPGYYRLEVLVPGQTWRYMTGGDVFFADSTSEFYFDTQAGKNYHLRVVMSTYGNSAEVAATEPVDYIAPAAEFAIGDQAYGVDVMYFDWHPVIEEFDGNVIELKAQCGDAESLYYNQYTFGTEVYGPYVFVTFSPYQTMTNTSRCYLTGRDRRTQHKLSSNELPLTKFEAMGLKFEPVSVNTWDAQFRVSNPNNVLRKPRVICNTPEDDTYPSVFPSVQFWEQDPTKKTDVGTVHGLVPGRRHMCALFADDVQSGQSIVIKPQFIVTQPMQGLTFEALSRPFVFDSNYVDTTFNWTTDQNTAGVQLDCVCDQPGTANCNFHLGFTTPNTQFGELPSIMLVREVYYTCTGTATGPQGDLIGTGGYSFLATP